MTTPITKILSQKKADIAAMQEAISFLEKGSQFPVDRSQMPILGKLEAMLSQAATADERSHRLQLAKQSLLETGRQLRQLETEVATLEAFEVQALRDLDTAIAKFNQLGEEQAAVAAQIAQLCRDSASAIAQLRGTAIFCPLPPKSAAVARYGNQILFAN